MTPEETFAAAWVEERRSAITELLREDVNLRYRIIGFLILDPKTGSISDGLPAIYLVQNATRDRLMYDILANALKSGKPQPDIVEKQRERITTGQLAPPKKPRGRPYKNGGRDFLFMIMCAELQARFPDLPFGRNEVTTDENTAMAVAFDALTAIGVPLITETIKTEDSLVSYQVDRIAEKALRRFLQGKHIPELFLL